MSKRVEQIRFQRQFSKERGSGNDPMPTEVAIDDLLSEIDRLQAEYDALAGAVQPWIRQAVGADGLYLNSPIMTGRQTVALRALKDKQA